MPYRPDEARITWREALRRKCLLLAGEFNTLLKRIPARKKVLVADSCHSGGLLKEMPSDSDEPVSKFYPFLDPDTGDEMLMAQTKNPPAMHPTDHEALVAACLKNQSSYESPRLRASVFTHYLVNAVNGGSASDLREAFEAARKDTLAYCVEATRRCAGKGKTFSQNPSLIDPHGFVVRFRFSR